MIIVPMPTYNQTAVKFFHFHHVYLVSAIICLRLQNWQQTSLSKLFSLSLAMNDKLSENELEMERETVSTFYSCTETKPLNRQKFIIKVQCSGVDLI